MSITDYYGTNFLCTFKHGELHQRYIHQIRTQKINLYLFLAYYIVSLSTTPIVIQYEALTGRRGVLWSCFTIIIIIQILICLTGVIILEISSYSGGADNLKGKMHIRESFITINNILSPIGIDLL